MWNFQKNTGSNPVLTTKIKVMNWIEVKDKKELPYDRKSILAQDEYGNVGVVYWNSYDWVYDIPGMGDEIELPGKIVKYIILK